MKGRRAGRRSLAARPRHSRVPSFTLFPPRLPPLSFRCFPHGQRGHVPVVMETRANRDGNSTVGRSPSSPPFLSLSLSIPLSPTSLFALRPSPTSPTCQRIRIPLSLSLSLSFPNYLSPHRAPSYHPAASLSSSSDRPRYEILAPSPSRTLACQSPGLVSLTHARRIVMGNVQMH